MRNPWEEISLTDYENHMRLDSVMQLQAMNEMMKGQFCSYPISSVMILGVAGGNGLEHIQKDKLDKVYGVDVNSSYLEETAHRYPDLDGLLECLCINLLNEADKLPKADMIIANSVAGATGAFGSDQNQVTILQKDQTPIKLARQSKTKIANEIIELVSAKLKSGD